MGFIVTRFGHGGQMIKMVISTMEHKNLAIGVGLCDLENSKNYGDAFACISSNAEVAALLNAPNNVFIYDRHKSIPKPINKAFPLAVKANDPIHLVRNLKKYHPKTPVGHLWSAMYALDKRSHDAAWDAFEKESPRGSHYLRNLPKISYCLYPRVELGIRMHGTHTSNPAEVSMLVSAKIGARHQPPTRYLAVELSNYLKEISFYQHIVAEAVRSGALLIPRAQHHLLSMQTFAAQFEVTLTASLKSIFVQQTRATTAAIRTVDLEIRPDHPLATCDKPECLLRYVGQHGWPCYHIVAASLALFNAKDEGWCSLTPRQRYETMFLPCYFVDAMQAAFSSTAVVRPRINNLKKDDTIAPVPILKPNGKGQYRTTRFTSAMEQQTQGRSYNKVVKHLPCKVVRYSHAVLSEKEVERRGQLCVTSAALSASAEGAAAAAPIDSSHGPVVDDDASFVVRQTSALVERGDDIMLDFPVDDNSSVEDEGVHSEEMPDEHTICGMSADAITKQTSSKAEESDSDSSVELDGHESVGEEFDARENDLQEGKAQTFEDARTAAEEVLDVEYFTDGDDEDEFTGTRSNSALKQDGEGCSSRRSW
jgi:hypothetical protein